MVSLLLLFLLCVGISPAKSDDLPWEFSAAVHTLAFELFHPKLQQLQAGFPGGIVGVGRLFVEADSNPEILEPWPTINHRQCALKLVASDCGAAAAGVKHTIEFFSETTGGGGGDLVPLPIAHDTQIVRTTLSNMGIESIMTGNLDEGQSVAFELKAPQGALGDARRLVFVPECTIAQRGQDPTDVVEVVGDGDDQWGVYETRGEPFPLSAELFEAAVALAVYTASSGNPMPQSPKKRGSETGPPWDWEWKMWYVDKYNAEWRSNGGD